MGENLVIVESPAKAKTIEKFLGKGYTVKSSYGHIRDLDDKKLSIDVKNGFEPMYVIPAAKKKVVSELAEAAAKADMVWLASDEDREGEAISWHLYDVLGLTPENSKRIAFHEITKAALLQAIENPRAIDMDLVMAQQARRVLDRLVGYELSPVLWKKVQRGLSAGRVQSVALRLIVDREREINAFSAQPFFKVEGFFTTEEGRSEVKAVCDRKFESEEEANAFLGKCRDAQFRINAVERRRGTRTPAAPFTTSVLQQEAARKLGFSVSQTMSIAQQLYERGLITYMRTDSTNLSSLAINTAKETIKEFYGEEYSKVRAYRTKAKGAQEAHEAIRPTYISNRSIDGNTNEKKLYNLIWKRTVACQMADAIIEKTTVSITSDKFSETFSTEGEQVVFDGFLKVYMESRDDEEDWKASVLPNLEEGMTLSREDISATERFSQRPPRYSEASLVKKLEELEIGRPSTYSPTITTIVSRGYITKGDKEGTVRTYRKLVLSGDKIEKSVEKETTGAEKKKLFPENIGIVVTDYLEKHFPNILDYGFTAKVEDDFDRVADGKLKWDKLIDNFYYPFDKQIEEAISDKDYTKGERVVGTDPVSGKVIIARIGPYGPMVQKGGKDDPDKCFASMAKGMLIESITLEEALKLFVLPRKVGRYEDFDITAAIGRFGPYIKYSNKFVSLGKGLSPYTISEEEAVNLIKETIEKEANRQIAKFEASGIEVLNGRFGPYIKQGKENYKIPKGTDAKTLTEEECKAIISAAASEPTKGKRTAKKKVSKK